MLPRVRVRGCTKREIEEERERVVRGGKGG